MTDVETNVSAKRKSFSNKQGKKESPKKLKVEKTKIEDIKTPQKGNAFNKNATPKQTKSQNSAQKPAMNKKRNTETGSSKALKPFTGTSQIQTPRIKENKKVKGKNEPVNTEVKKEEGVKKKRRGTRGIFIDLTRKVNAGEKEVIKILKAKIEDIKSRGELSKTGKKKLRYLIKLQNTVEGKTGDQIKQEKAPHGKSVATKRRERKKKQIDEADDTSETKVKTVLKTGGAKVNGKANKKPGNKQEAKKIKLEPKLENDSDNESSEEVDAEESEEESDAEASEGESDEVEGEEEVSDEIEGEEGVSDESDEEEEESEEESVPQDEDVNSEKAVPRLNKGKGKNGNETKKGMIVNVDELKKHNFLTDKQKRFVLFIGNIPFDSTKVDLIEHFQKCGKIKDVRIPTVKNSSQLRGFAYLDVGDKETYQKCLSMHHSFLKGRRINVLYTTGGKKNGDEKKKIIKAKNFKLGALRRQGKLVGSKKETQLRSFRRAKQRAAKSQSEAVTSETWND